MRALMILAALLIFPLALPVRAEEEAANGRYKETRFVANKKLYKPEFAVVPEFINAWGISTRPAGAGGHFWVLAKDISYEYVGDVQASPDAKLRTLHQDDLKIVTLPIGGKDNFATGTVFVDSKDGFIITQEVRGSGPITAPAKFLFASDGGIISAWTERKKADGSFDRPADAVTVIDQSGEGAQFFGLAISHDYTRIYAADFGARPAVKVFGKDFKPANVTFGQPFDTNKNGVVDPGEYAPFNVQALTTPAGQHRIFVAYALTQPCPAAEVEAGTCKEGELFVGEEDTGTPGNGRVAEFTEDGGLVAVWKDGGKLSAPWGLAFSPAHFGAYSNKLLVGNFGDGTIAAYDPDTREFAGVLQDSAGKPLVIDKLWAIIFGNGASLGDTNALYYAAGPEDEMDGLFGSLRPME